jgi:hypothetical protein
LGQACLCACGNQFSGQLKLGRLCLTGLANGGVGQQFGFHGFQAFQVDTSSRFNAVSMALRGVVCVFFTNTCSTSKVRPLHSDGLIFNLFAK